MEKLRVLDLFAGIGGFSLGLERTGGFTTAAFCEREPYPRKILAQWWPEVPIYDDVCTLTAERLAADGIAVDVVTGGFPCQDISFAGKGAGLAGERSGLFYEVARLIGELEPRFVILENVSALLSRGLDAVLGTLASLGYDAEWHCIPASYLGAPHRRDRIWIIAYPHLYAGEQRPPLAFDAKAKQFDGWTSEGRTLADTFSARQSGQGQSVQPLRPAAREDRQAIDALASSLGDIWRTEPDVGRVANGVPDRAHRLKALGNAVVPAIPELIGRAILQAEDLRSRPLSGDAQKGGGVALSPAPSPTLNNVSHTCAHSGETL
jgi:DNA (cytosine-5)-methyltransferase 1